MNRLSKIEQNLKIEHCVLKLSKIRMKIDREKYMTIGWSYDYKSPRKQIHER